MMASRAERQCWGWDEWSGESDGWPVLLPVK